MTRMLHCASCPSSLKGCVLFSVRGMRVALSGEQLRDPSVFLHQAAEKPVALQHATEELCIDMCGYRLSGGDGRPLRNVPSWRVESRRGYVHARGVMLLSNMSIGEHRLSLFLPEATSPSVTLMYEGMEHHCSGLMSRVEEIYGSEARTAAESVHSGSPSSLTLPVCSLAAAGHGYEGMRVSSFTCMTRMLCMVTGVGLLTLSRAVTTKIHETIKRRRRTGVDLTLDCVNYGKYISVSSESGPVVNLTPNGVVLYMGSPTQYPVVMSKLLRAVTELFTSGQGTSVAGQMRKLVKYRWVLKLSETA